MAYIINMACLLAQTEAAPGTTSGDVVTTDGSATGNANSDNSNQQMPVSLDSKGDPTGNPPQGTPEHQTTNPWQHQLLIMGLMLVVIYFFMFRGPQKRQKELKQMMENLKRGQKIRTIGGIIGKVVEVNENEVVVKVDESNNTKMTFVRNAIATVITDDQKDSKS